MRSSVPSGTLCSMRGEQHEDQGDEAHVVRDERGARRCYPVVLRNVVQDRGLPALRQEDLQSELPEGESLRWFC